LNPTKSYNNPIHTKTPLISGYISRKTCTLKETVFSIHKKKGDGNILYLQTTPILEHFVGNRKLLWNASN
jgi:hypothetical protein